MPKPLPDMQRKDSGGSRLFLPVFLLSCTGLLIYLKIGFVFMFFAILPSFITYYLDRERGRPTFRTVLACNLASALHPIADMYSHGVNMSYERFHEGMGEPKIWLFIYAGAIAGWGLIYFCRFLAHFTVGTYHEYQLYHLDRQQEWLTNEWGNGIVPSEE